MKEPKDINVLVACEESQTVCKAFRERGFNAYSNDIQDCSGGHPEWHLKMDSFEAIKLMDWDLMIAHPPCTYLSNMGACILFKGGEINKERYQKGLEAKIFFESLLNANIKYIAVENPIQSKIFGITKYNQIIQPYEYGHPYSKKTCLWLKNLPKLIPTNIIKEYYPFVSAGNNRKSDKIKNYRDPKMRSKTFQGIAQAMAQQWGDYLLKELNK